MECALCKEERELRDSHIIPEFIYKSMYDEKHRFHVLSTAEDIRNHTKPKGLYEKLLCDECEARFQRWESYSAKVMKGGVPLGQEKAGNLVVVTGIDYAQFKLFQMSILWRASASVNRMFERVSLGPHQEKLRTFLLREEPGNVLDYPCIMFALMHEGRVMEDLIDQPTRVKIDGHWGYRFVFGGFVWVYVVSSHFSDPVLRDAVLNLERLCILPTEFSEATPLLNFGRRLREMGRM